jgi:hypothetical protein
MDEVRSSRIADATLREDELEVSIIDAAIAV